MASKERAKQGLREMTRRAVRSQIAEAAMALFAKRGFEATTVDEIAAEVGISSRSVFRYFPTKEDMVVGHLDEIGDKLAAALEERPTDEAPWVALRHAMQPHLDDLIENADAMLATALMLSEAPALRGALLSKRARWTELLVPNVMRRLKGSAQVREVQARAVVSAALACLNTAVDEWARSDGTKSVEKLLDQAISAVRS
ncbi:TetR/AcrR family transcriptional regulator [Saccharopolyspora sp. K220]|uniref:TetR family transcriptional regulator n=1 Tax=Saccharopolyspora soli TaxID=2926618 RepID=UPI001F590BE0|nr:TetR family transcriptional regulator [Saccharopolyspora soli]MCI2417488.1 TetR/AcrR family transcriptional regulator [Saccharopolyspora soli]